MDEPSPVHEANRAIAVAMAEGPARDHDAISAYQMALQLDPAHAERAFIQKRIS